MPSTPHTVDIWVWPIDGGAERARAFDPILSVTETARAARFLNPAHGHEFAIAHGRTRELLGARLGLDPASLAFAAGEHGKPRLTGVTSTLTFNLSHSGGLAALAMADGFDIGIDIEEIRPIRENIAERYFSALEIAQIRALPEALQDDAFFRCWTRKEAIVKALGDGLTMPLDRFAVDVLADAERGLVESVDETSARCWRLAPFLPGPSHHGAVAARTDGRPIAVTRHT